MRKKLYPFLNGMGLEALESRTLLSVSPASAKDPATVDLMVVYTPAARDAAGGTAGMANLIQHDVDLANQVLSNSDIYVSLRLVYSGVTDYAESGSAQTDLARLAGQSDGFLDSVHSIRDAVGADLVSLYTATRDADAGGLAYVLNDLDASDNDRYGFSVIGMPNNATPDALIHEIGHNFGAEHDHAHLDQPGAFDYSQGYTFTADGVLYGDVMSNANCTRIPYFSNPDIKYNGKSIGDAADADNARTINQTAPIVAAYRSPDHSTPTAQLVNPDPPQPGDDSYAFSVKYTDPKGIQASTLGDGDILVSGPNGFSQAASLVSFDQTSDSTVVAKYRIDAPEGGWSQADSGSYAFTLVPGEVTDSAGNSPASADLGVVDAQFPPLPNFAPLKPANWSDSIIIATQRGTTTDAGQIFDDQDIYLSRAIYNSQPGTRLSQTLYDDLYVDGVYRTTYATRPQDINPYGGISNLDFDLGQLSAGRHSVTIVMDSHNLIDESNESDNTYTRSFTVTPRDQSPPDENPPTPKPPPPAKDQKPPVAKLHSARPVSKSSKLFKFTVTYSDNIAVLRSSLGSGDVLVVGPHGFKQKAKLVGASRKGNGSPIIATYSIQPPGSGWDWKENGVYTIKIHSGQVADTSKNYASGGVLGKFTVKVAKSRGRFSTRHIKGR